MVKESPIKVGFCHSQSIGSERAHDLDSTSLYKFPHAQQRRELHSIAYLSNNSTFENNLLPITRFAPRVMGKKGKRYCAAKCRGR